MVQIRKVTGKESTNFWADRWGAKAGEAPMVSRVRTRSTFSNQGLFGYDITNSASYSNNNILIHSIKCINTQTGVDYSDDAEDHAIMEIFENPYESTVAHAYTDNDIALALTSVADFNTTGSGTIKGITFAWTGKNPSSTLAVEYIDGQLAVHLASGHGAKFAGSPSTGGTGTIDGDAFTWTSKNSDILTVPDLNDDYDVGVTINSTNTLIVGDLGANFAVGDKVVNMSSLAPGSGVSSLKLKFMINAQKRMNSAVTLVFPIPMLLVNGGRVKRITADDGPIINICYTVLESKGDIDPHKDIFLQSAYTAGNLEDTVVTGGDVEVYGAYVNHVGTSEESDSYAGLKIKNAAGAERARVDLNEMLAFESGDIQLGGTNSFPMWFPYPVYLKDGFIQGYVGNAADNGDARLFSTSFYRKVNAKGIDHGWT